MSWRRNLEAVLLAGLLTTPALATEPLTNDERQQLEAHLEASRQHFRDAVAGLSAEQWAYKPAADRWSVAECAEHLAAAEEMIVGRIEGALETPTSAEALEGAGGREAEVVAFMKDRSQKFSAPEVVAPTNRWSSPAEMMAVFEEERSRALEIAGGTSDLRAHAAEHPAFGSIDLTAWLYLLSSHTDRHVDQIAEIKASEGYPR